LKDKTIGQLFEERAALIPERISIVYDDKELTYSELNLRADRLSLVLQTYNIGSGDFVGLLLKRSPELIISLLALFKVGAAYVPLNLTDPENRIMSIIKAADIKFVITNAGNNIDLTGKCERLNIEQLINQSGDFQISGNKSVIKSTDPAYIIFTSGTTGTPKGVLVNHKSVINIIEWVNKTFKISYTDKLLWITNLSFDLSVYDIFGILAAGGIIRILSDDDRQDPAKQYDILLNEGITFWDSAPQSLLQLTPFFNRKNKPAIYNSLRLVFLSGDWIPLSLPPSVTSVFPSAVVVGLGGATEATIWSNYFIIDKIDPQWKSIPYGKPIQNARYYILDDKLGHCRIQQPGNLYIGGDCLALGYYNDPVLTNSKFIQDPYNPGSNLYLTGDKAQWMADGNIEFLGRVDEQIKIRGYRVEIGEIRNAVIQNKAVKDAIVIPDKSDRHNIKVILFITTGDNTKLDIKDIKRELRGRLPEYMIPSDIIQCAEFPVTANGKIDSKALLLEYSKSLIDSQKKQLSYNYVEDIKTLTATEQIIHKIWCETLKTSEITVTDNFFDIGGNSLIAIRVINTIREKFGHVLTFREFITNPTINQLGVLLENQNISEEKGIKLVHLSRRTNLPLTLNQKRLWLISKIQPDVPSYIISFTFKFYGSLNLEIFQNSIDLLFQRHYVIFSVIKEADGVPYCDIVPSKVDISFVDYSGLPENEKSEKVNDVINSDSVKVFDLKNGPLYRLNLIMTGPNEYFFHISIHHIVFDGWSWSVLAIDLNEIYNSLLAGKKVNLKAIEFQQYDYAEWEKSPEGSKNEDESIKFWKENLEGTSSILNFPYDFQRTDKPSGRGGYETILLSQDLSEKLRCISKAEDSSLFAVILSAFGIQLQKYSGENDINVGLPVAYRPHSNLENIFGMFVNTVVVRLRNEKEFTFRNIIHQTNDAALNAIAHQDLPFEKVVEVVNPKRSLNTNPIFQFAFAWQNNLDEPLNLDGIRTESITEKNRTSIFDLTLYMWENGSHIEGGIEYNIDIIGNDTVIRLKDTFIHLLQTVTENPDQAISEISLLSETDRNKLFEFNNTITDIPDCLIQNLFENQTKITPLKTSVISGGINLTYQELDIQSNQLANYLMNLKLTPGNIVGVCVERSVEMVISVLAVLKAGCCYLPLDPSFPDDRIKYMYEDSGAKVLISQSSLKEKFNQFTNTSIVLIDACKRKINKCSTHKPNLNINSQSFAYIIYTSGSTGKPKGVKVHHKSVVNLIESMSKEPGIKKSDILLAVVTLSFDMSVFELFLPLSKGATVVVANSNDTTNGKALINLIDTHTVTMLQATPSFWNILLASGWKGKKDLRAFCGGEALTKNMIRQILPKVAEFWNCYGPTETTVYSTFIKVTDPDAPILIGKPLSNTRIYILDENSTQLPIGVIGQVCIGGLGVTKGYNNLPELTAEKFIPFENEQIIYKTGDLGRFLKDGNIELFGRIDNQIKLRGFRIEPGEIESLLLRLSGVKEAVVKLHKFDENDERLVAFLNVGLEFNLPKEEIVRYLVQHLPAYMIPSFFQRSDGFPRLPNGKINKKALNLEIDETVRNIEIDPDLNTFNQSELKIYDIWCEALKTKDISKTDNFFDIGGNSLLAISVFSKIELAFNVDLGLRIFFDGPRIKDLAEAVDFAKHKDVKNKSFQKTDLEDTRIIEGEI
jgi:amino acid adenylation domain-containing protein